MVNASPELSSHFQSISPREALILKTLINHPWLIDEHSEAIASIDFVSPALSALATRFWPFTLAKILLTQQLYAPN